MFTEGGSAFLRTIQCSYFGPSDPLVGWKGVGYHLVHADRVQFSAVASAAAHQLVQLAGLYPATATPEEMDAVDAQFLCMACPAGPRGREAMGLLLHAVKCAKEDPTCTLHGSSWRRLFPLGAADIRRREGPDPAFMDRHWLCALCPAHLSHRETRATVIEHVAEVHEIRGSLGVHVLYYAGAKRTPRKPVYLPDGEEYQCTGCAAGAPVSVKLLALRDLKAHIRAVHNVEPSERDWTKVERVMADTIALREDSEGP
ncbi:hypothetical protein DFH09DRAFT_1401886 [Mycena vulgaris]|nr:hypothetical protein DFH09DRAFT_1401886 [Mycena vulgaris]